MPDLCAALVLPGGDRRSGKCCNRATVVALLGQYSPRSIFSCSAAAISVSMSVLVSSTSWSSSSLRSSEGMVFALFEIHLVPLFAESAHVGSLLSLVVNCPVRHNTHEAIGAVDQVKITGLPERVGHPRHRNSRGSRGSRQ